ncbi:MAG: hypothetical protein ACP5G1_00070 [Nanopusillaceae archaeon]
MRSDILTKLVFIMFGILIGVIILVLFVPPTGVTGLFGGKNENIVYSFNVSVMYFQANGEIYAIIYNNGNGAIELGNISAIASEYEYISKVSTGNRYSCRSNSSGTLYPQNQTTILLNCDSSQIIVENLLSTKYYYVFRFQYNGKDVVQSTLGTKE